MTIDEAINELTQCYSFNASEKKNEAISIAIKALEEQQKFNSNEFFEWLNNFDLEVDVGIYGVPAKLNLRHNIWYGKKKEFRSKLGWLSAELNEKIDAKMPLGNFLKRILEKLPEPYQEGGE